MDENDENFLPDVYDFEESLIKNNKQDIEPKFEPCADVDVADSMDTIVNTDSRSAMALD